jgi:hypothetical protein
MTFIFTPAVDSLFTEDGTFSQYRKVTEQGAGAAHARIKAIENAEAGKRRP